ncbi:MULTISPECIES: DUF1906 domain-containing protein [Paenibacillaceae]|uniref:DUF1906 domain-containing protein n=1 Tax=unclassified Paenibacillus TaxID=185978 RepID=UPI0016425E80|nr:MULTISPECIES: DUF1906 domain-containing protein [Paenibacillaceae]MBU5445605.1 DUF1906 domain-containing protein [Paenibacillus sp. MSJ-34]
MARNAFGIDRAAPFGSSDSDALWCLFNNGVRAVGRYYGTSWKQLTAQEALRLAQHGLEIWTVYQLSNNKNEDFSYNKGYEAAKNAVSQAEDAGQPHYSAIYFGVDYDAQPTDLQNYVKPYFEGVQQYMRDLANQGKSNYKIGVYGGYNTIRYIYSNVPDVVFKWQTRSFSQGQVDSGAHIYQYDHDQPYTPCSSGSNNVGSIDKNDIDDSDGVASYGGWYAAG